MPTGGSQVRGLRQTAFCLFLRLVRARWFQAIAFGVTLALSAPPFPHTLVFLMPIGVGGLAWVLRDAPTKRSAFGRAWLWGSTVNLVAMAFVSGTVQRFTELPTVVAMLAWVLVAILGQGLAWGVGGWVSAFAARTLHLAFPLAFGLGIATSMFVPQLFPWTAVAPLTRAPFFLQAADLLGERGMATLIAILLSMSVELVAKWRRADKWRQVAWLLASLALMFGYDTFAVLHFAAVRTSAPSRTIALVQHAVIPEERWEKRAHNGIVRKLWALTERAESMGATMTIWPEAAYPFDIRPETRRDGNPRIRGPRLTRPVLTGILAHIEGEPDGKDRYNAAILVQADGDIGSFSAKRVLLAFGEAVPFGEEIPWLRETFARAGSMRPGKAATILETTDSLPTIRAAILNCYEDTLPALARTYEALNPNLLVNITNDAWFGDSAEPDLHLLAATTRSIELRRDMVRAVNTGTTVHLDALGREVARLPRGAADVLVTDVRLLSVRTLYGRFGDAGWLVLLGLCSTISVVRRTLRRQAPGALQTASDSPKASLWSS